MVLKKIRLAPLRLPRTLLHWTTTATQMCHNHSQHVLVCKDCLARPALLTSLGGWGRERPLLCRPCCHAQLPAPHPFAKSPTHTLGFAVCRTEPHVPGNTCPYSRDSAERGRYLENYTAEKAISDSRKKTWHLLPYGRRKKVPCDFGFSECWHHNTLGKLLDLLMHWRHAPHEHMLWQTLFE